MRAKPEGFGSLEEAADAIAAFLPHRPRPRNLAGLAKNLREQPDGRWRWHWDPGFMGGGLELSAESPARFEHATRALGVPVLLVRGGSSDILSEDGVRAFLEVLPTAESVDVAGAAHMVAGDQNDPFNASVVEFLTRVLGDRIGAHSKGTGPQGVRA
jgi:non-heme chloroperoxidase